jgi:predicted transport protein
MMTSDGSSYARFRRALLTKNLTLIRAAAAELPQVRLEDALQVCVLLRDREPERYEAAAVRWIGRFCVEKQDVSLEDVDHARSAFSLMRREPERALAVLQALCAGP